MSEPRGVEAKLTWMERNPPGKVGMCARTCWHALGGNQDPPSPPRWGTADANAVYDKVIASKRYWRDTPIPRGALIVWKYGEHGHTALSYGDGKIMTTDPSGGPGGTGVEALSYPHKWGATASKRIWTDQYAGTLFPIGGTGMADQWEYFYSGKPEGTLVVGTKYTLLDASRWNPTYTGVEFAMVYLNVTPVFKDGKTMGAVRVRSVRADGDTSSYHDYPVSVDTLSGGSQLITHIYFEKGDAKTTYYQVKCIGGLKEITIGTRYRKGAVDR